MLGRSHTERIVRMINETEPDLVAIVGDLVDGTVSELGAAVEPLQDLAAREGSFFVTGNHEYFTDETGEWLRELERLGVAPLRNENTPIRRGRASFALAGVNDVAGNGVRTHRTSTGPWPASPRRRRRSCSRISRSRSPRPPNGASTCSSRAIRTAASCGRSTTSCRLCSRRSPGCRPSATPSCT